ARLARKATKRILLESIKSVRVTPRTLGKYAGIRKFRYGATEGEDQVGVVTGLAYTEFGGDLLQIESVTVPGKGNMKTTGKLGEVMTESIQAATSFVR
ncbi:S16 family serine protease, partial [Thalassospira lucentensis]|nr:endopeptidase La [Thalassospira lucentensis]